MNKKQSNVKTLVPATLKVPFFGTLGISIISFYTNLPVLNGIAAFACIGFLFLFILNSDLRKKYLLILLNVCVVLTIVSTYLREYYNYLPVFAILSDSFYGLCLIVTFINFRIKKSKKEQSDWKQVLLIFGMAIPFIYITFEKVNFDYQVLIMMRMIIFSITVYYGLFRNYLHHFVSIGLLLNLFSTMTQGYAIFVNPNFLPIEIQTIIYLIGIYFIIVGLVKSEKLGARF